MTNGTNYEQRYKAIRAHLRDLGERRTRIGGYFRNEVAGKQRGDLVAGKLADKEYSPDDVRDVCQMIILGTLPFTTKDGQTLVDIGALFDPHCQHRRDVRRQAAQQSKEAEEGQKRRRDCQIAMGVRNEDGTPGAYVGWRERLQHLNLPDTGFGRQPAADPQPKPDKKTKRTKDDPFTIDLSDNA